VSSTGYIVAAWVVTFGVTAGYSLWIVLRGRRLSQEVPPAQRRWMTAGSRGRE
jgi:hypothetical protein